MSAGNIVVEIELRDGQYHSGMTRAATDADRLTSGIRNLDSRMQGLQNSLSGALPKLRDTAIIVASLHSAYSMLDNSVGAFARSLIDANAKIEKTQILLQGMSKSIEIKDKTTDAAKDLNFLFDTAKKAPFSLDQITNSFVKMRAVGIGDVEQKIKNLTNAIANFGGDDQTLHKATIAIQQMASKGILSMEELRQQLGEALPNAMNMMADGMGMTMQSLNKKISEGKIKSIQSIEGMMYEMELSMSGSSVKMMGTWSGMTSQMATNWALLQKQIGDAGFFNAAKDELSKLNELLQSDTALKYGQMTGDAIKGAIDGVKSLSGGYEDNKGVIVGATKALLEFWLVSKGIAASGALWNGGMSVVGSMASQSRALQAGMANARNPMAPSVIPMNWGSNNATVEGQRGINTVVASGAAVGRISSGMGQIAASTTLWQRSIAQAGVALGVLTGPIGMLVVGTAVIAAQFLDFTSATTKAREGLQGVIDKQKELNKIAIRPVGDAALKTYADIAEAEKNLKVLQGLSNPDGTRNTDPITDSHKVYYSGDQSAFSTLNKSKEAQGLAQLKKNAEDQKVASQAIYESRIEWFDRTIEHERSEQSKQTEILKASTTTEYNIKKEAINKAVDAEVKANESRKGDAVLTDKQINEIKRLAFLELHKQINSDQIKIFEEQKNQAITAFADLQSRVKPIKIIVDDQQSSDALKTQETTLIFGIAQIKAAIASTVDEQKKLDLKKALTVDERSLKETTLKIKGLDNEIKNLKANGGITETDVVNFGDIKSKIQSTTDELKRLGGMRDKLAQGISPGDGAEITGESQKAVEAQKKKLATEYDRSSDGMKEAAAEFAKAFDPETFSAAIAKGADSIGATLASLNKAIVDGKDFASNGKANVLATTANIIRQTSPDQQSNRPYGELFTAATDKYNLPPNLINAIAQVESRTGKNQGSSSAGALGVMQLMPETARGLGVSDRTDAKQSIDGAGKLLRELLDTFDNDIIKTIAAYNSRPKTVKAANGDLSKLPNETQAYIPQVTNEMARLSNGSVAGKDVVDTRSRQEVNADIANHAALSDALKAEAKSQEGLLKIKQNSILSDEQAAKQRDLRDRKIPTAIDSADTVAIKAQIEKYKLSNLNTDRLNEQLRVSVHNDANAAQMEGDKKTQAEFDRIKNEAQAKYVRGEEFKKDLDRTTNQLLVASQQALVKDGKLLYEQDSKNYAENLKDRATDKGVALDKDLEDLVKNQAKMFEATRANVAKIEAEINKTNLNFSIASAAVGRSSATPIDKDTQRLELDKQQALFNNSLVKQSPLQDSAAIENINAKYRSDLEDLKYAHRDAFQQMMSDTVNFSAVAGDAQAMFTTGAIDGTAQLLTEGTANFKKFSASVMKDIGAMLIKMALLQAAQMIVGAIGGAAGGAAGVANGTNVSSNASFTGPVMPQKDGGVFDITKFADGGVRGAKLASKSEMSNGGVKDKPHVALFAEAGVPEAFIPMRDGKTIPISVTQDKNGVMTAAALLPNGKSIPASVQNPNITKFAQGGVMGRVGLTPTNVANSSPTLSITNPIEKLIASLSLLTNSLSQLQASRLIPDSVGKASALSQVTDRQKEPPEPIKSGGNTVSIQISVAGDGSDAKQNTKNSNQGDGVSGKMWDNLAQNIKVLVVKTINEEKRPNGALWSAS